MNNERFFNYSATPQLVVDPLTDRLVAVNQELCRLLQMDVVALQQKKPSDLFSPEFPRLIAFTQEVMEQGRGWCDNLWVKSSDDELRVEAWGRCTSAGDEQLLHLSLQHWEQMERLRERAVAQQHFCSGIGHWNRVSQVFQEFERENQLLLDAAGEGIYGVDANGITTFVNPAAERILGYQAVELAGRNMHRMVHHSRCDGTHFDAIDCPIFAAIHDGNVHVVDDDVFWDKAGNPIDVEYTSTPIRDNGFIIGAVVVFRDVSQKKKDQKQLMEAMTEVEKLKNRLELEKAYLQEEIKSEYNHHQIIGNSPAIKQIIQQIHLVAPTDTTVMINGESGTGKELLARAIHELGQRSARSLVRVNCAAIPEDLFESEFFGHAKGAFTGAIGDRPGRFELADGGTLFLDEVGEIPLRLQGKLLRVLQEQQFERVGESKTRHVDVRIIAATNRDLRGMVDNGSFREDLYFRLNVFPIISPPLRQRVTDIPMLTQHFLEKACRRASKTGLKIPLAELEKLKHYHWPGNIRELENVVERQVILVRGNTLRFDGLRAGNQTQQHLDAPPEVPEITTLAEIKERERKAILIALQRSSGRVSGSGGAAELLVVKPTTLASKIRKLKIDVRDFKDRQSS